MKREEAIKLLHEISDQCCETANILCTEDADKRCDALDIAIEALENKPTPCEKCIHVKSCRKVIILKNRTYKLIKYCSQGAERRKS